jgi:antitoxin component YwqK of YwqJK toxin-antitoxin module
MKNILTMLIVTLPYLITITYLFATDSMNDQGDIGKECYETGQLDSETPLVNDIIPVIWKQYYETGQLKSETPLVNNKEHGIYREYYKNGKLKEESRYVLGKLRGTTNSYDENGNLIIKK